MRTQGNSVATPHARGSTRAEAIGVLRAEIAQLQQERLAWGQDETDGTAGTPQPEADRKLAAIERRLTEAQRDLARYQGRI
jgi:hypothetical protein